MKKAVQTTVKWQFPTEAKAGYPEYRIFLQGKDKKEWVLGSVEITSWLHKHPAGRCVSVVVNVANPPHGVEARTHEILQTEWEGLTDEVQRRDQKELGYLKLTSSMFDGVIGHDGRAYSVQWKLQPNEGFLDGAVRIGVEILTKTGAAGRYEHFRSKWMLGNFEVTQKTFVCLKDSSVLGWCSTGTWQPIARYLCYKHGLQE